jgi:glyoxylase-like metal-dependent hydrolase (beta-lactamase superfamily II)
LHLREEKQAMADDTRTFRLGTATISVINLGTLQGDLAEWLRVPESDWPPKYADDFRRPIPVPVQCVHIALPGASVLVDACDTGMFADSSFAPAGYQPPPSLAAQLAGIGVRPETIDHVVITHGHFDHYSGIVQAGGEGAPLFPRARHYLGRADWEQAQPALQDPDSLEGRTLAIVQRHGLIELVDQRRDLGNGVQIIATPGETPGHQIVRLSSEGQTLYCLGDLYHHPVELERPDWMVHWADAPANLRSRGALVEAASAERALLVATHIAAIGHVRLAPEGIIWEAAPAH